MFENILEIEIKLKNVRFNLQFDLKSNLKLELA